MSNKFNYTYSPADKSEIEAIKSKYSSPGKQTLFEEIKLLDKKTETCSSAYSVCFGLFFALIFGAGLSICLTSGEYYIGVPLGVIGIAGMGAAPFVNEKIKQYKRKKISKKIVAMCNDYLKAEGN